MSRLGCLGAGKRKPARRGAPRGPNATCLPDSPRRRCEVPADRSPTSRRSRLFSRGYRPPDDSKRRTVVNLIQARACARLRRRSRCHDRQLAGVIRKGGPARAYADLGASRDHRITDLVLTLGQIALFCQFFFGFLILASPGASAVASSVMIEHSSAPHRPWGCDMIWKSMRCPSCSEEILEPAASCPACGWPAGDRVARDELDATRQPSTRDLPDTEPSRPGLPPRFSAGEVVADRYRIGRLLGRGGMGEVYRAGGPGMPGEGAGSTARVGMGGGRDPRRLRR